MNQLQTVSEKIYELLPRLKELSFGCVVQYKTSKEVLGSVELNDRLDWCNWSGRDSDGFDPFGDDSIIIGHPITLEGVLESLSQIATSEYVLVASIDKSKACFCDDGFNVLSSWQYGKPLSEQSPELISLLHNLLITDDKESASQISEDWTSC